MAGSKVSKISMLLLWLTGAVIIGLSIAGVSNAQLVFSKHMFIVIIVLVVFAYLLAIFSYCLQKKRDKNNYDVNDAAGDSLPRKSGTANKAYIAEQAASGAKGSGGSGGVGTDQKWVSNYVPYGEYPKGSTNGAVTTYNVEHETAASSNGVSNGDNKWQKNYVPYEEEEQREKGQEDSNGKE